MGLSPSSGRLSAEEDAIEAPSAVLEAVWG
jgi:hypothetical protein